MKQILLIVIGMSLSLVADFSRDGTTQIVLDYETGLQWTDNEIQNRNWISAISYCENLVLGAYNDWRPPNINELLSLVDDTKIFPAMDSIFQKIGTRNYWSSTTNDNNSSFAWIVNFGDGIQHDYDKSYSNTSVRCVRGGQ